MALLQTTKKHPRVKIRVPGPTGRGTSLEVDGEDLAKKYPIVGFVLSVNAKEANRLSFEMFVGEIEGDIGQAVVKAEE